MTATQDISIHAPRTGSDGSTINRQTPEVISIHAPRTGSDRGRAWLVARAKNFNPRSPHGERLRSAFMVVSLVIFQSTLPARGAT